MRIKHLLITVGVVGVISELLGWRYLYDCKYDKREKAKQLVKTFENENDFWRHQNDSWYIWRKQDANKTTKQLVLYSGLELLGWNIISVLIPLSIPLFIIASPVIIPAVILAKLIGPNAGR